MARKYRKFSPEFRDEAVRMVIDTPRPIAQVARELGVNEGTIGNWVNQYRKEHAGEEPPLTPHERIQLAEAQRELRELRMENEFMKKVIMPAGAGTRDRMSRVHAQLARAGVPCGPELVRSIMRELGLQPCQPRPWRAGLTEQDGREHHIPDLLARDFAAGQPGEKFVGDITYIPTWEGWLYLATVIDCHTKMVVGYAMDDSYKTPLITAALRDAVARTTNLAPDAIFHSDRGSNYTSHEFATAITELGLRHSVGRTGICYDNAMAESFFAALKNERVHRTVYATHAHARADIARYIEFWYNMARLHSGLDYKSPQEVLNEWTESQRAA